MPDFHIQVVPVTPFEQNCSLVWSDATKRGAVIDPGGDIDRIAAAVQAAGFTVETILLTHGHIDHAGGAAELKERLGVPVIGPHEGDRGMLERLDQQGRMYGL
ncbi:MAG: MBL fold metallo-hydrolase, partial [Methylobacteriaceae bacterium]|nr:MBL fold metallo-hydrolase [Methylobacteriaceae bacterium]